MRNISIEDDRICKMQKNSAWQIQPRPQLKLSGDCSEKLFSVKRETDCRGDAMRERKEVLDYGLTLPDTYIDTPFHDDNWVLLRYRKNKRAFAWTYERNGQIWVNVKVDPQWRDFWRNTYASVLPGYHQNKEHWNSIILDGSIPDKEIRRMISESYDLITKKH